MLMPDIFDTFTIKLILFFFTCYYNRPLLNQTRINLCLNPTLLEAQASYFVEISHHISENMCKKEHFPTGVYAKYKFGLIIKERSPETCQKMSKSVCTVIYTNFT